MTSFVGIMRLINELIMYAINIIMHNSKNPFFIDCSALSRLVLFGPLRADAFNRPESTVLLISAAPLVHHSSSAAFVSSTMLRQLSILNFDSSELLRTIDLLSSR